MRPSRRANSNRDVVAVVRFQGPKASGMPELHRLTPPLAVLQDKGFRVALVTDGRMSGASGKVPAAIHVTPEAVDGGPIARIRDGDIIRLDADAGTLEVLVDAADFQRARAVPGRSVEEPVWHGPRTLRRLPQPHRLRRSGRIDFRGGVMERPPSPSPLWGGLGWGSTSRVLGHPHPYPSPQGGGK